MLPNEQLSQWIESSHKIVFFGGAGTSTASGIPDFRSANGLYATAFENLSPEVILSHSYFMRETKSFYQYLRQHLYYPNAKPNACHLGLAALEQQGKIKAVITQNIDALHQKAGSQRLIELHGCMERFYCMRCGQSASPADVFESTPLQPIPICKKCGGIIRPDVTLYEEMLDETAVEGAIEAISEADLLIIGGTSLAVYPAAGFIRYYRGQHIVLINLTETPYDQQASLILREPIDLVFEDLVLRHVR